MGYAVYDSATRRVRDALDVLERLRRREMITADNVRAVQLSRRARAAALQQTFSELQQAFITPIDREDLLWLCQTTDAVYRAAEDIILALFACGRSALTPNDTAAISTAVQECTLLAEAVDALGSYPRCDTAVQKLTALEHLHYERADESTSPITQFCDTCLTTAECLRRILLKMI